MSLSYLVSPCFGLPYTLAYTLNDAMVLISYIDGLGNTNDFSSDLSSQTINMQNAPFSAVPPAPSAPGNTNQTSSQASSLPAPPPTSTPSQNSSQPTSTPTSKRKQSHKPTPMSVEEASQNAAEEDKRRRNTAASARFRVKKKLREQALEKTVKDTTARNTALEARVSQLELENQWLKNVITEKNDGTSGEGKKSENDIAEMFKKFLASQKSEKAQSSLETKSGVGTTA